MQRGAHQLSARTLPDYGPGCQQQRDGEDREGGPSTRTVRFRSASGPTGRCDWKRHRFLADRAPEIAGADVTSHVEARTAVAEFFDDIDVHLDGVHRRIERHVQVLVTGERKTIQACDCNVVVGMAYEKKKAGAAMRRQHPPVEVVRRWVRGDRRAASRTDGSRNYSRHDDAAVGECLTPHNSHLRCCSSRSRASSTRCGDNGHLSAGGRAPKSILLPTTAVPHLARWRWRTHKKWAAYATQLGR